MVDRFVFKVPMLRMQLFHYLLIIELKEDRSISLCTWCHVFWLQVFLIILSIFLYEFIILIGCVFQVFPAVQEAFYILFIFMEDCWHDPVFVGNSAIFRIVLVTLSIVFLILIGFFVLFVFLVLFLA